jgi:CBS-domain-containing membrane protein
MEETQKNLIFFQFFLISVMAANEQHAVPVWDGRADRYCGTLTPTDLLQLLLMCSDTKEHASCLQVCC